MKIVGLLGAVFCVFLVNAQNSYYFAEPLPSVNMKVERVSEKYFGTYVSGDGNLEYQFDANGLTLISVSVASMSRETIRESSKYSVRNGYIFGVEAGDSLPCVLEGELYWFGVRNRDAFVGALCPNILTKTSDASTYVLNVFNNGRYVPQLLHFRGNKLTVSHFDYEGESMDEFGYIAQQEASNVGELNEVILAPVLTDFERIKSQAFPEAMSLKK